MPPPGLAMAIAEALTSTYIPTLMRAAREQAQTTFGGRYRYTGNATAAAAAAATHGRRFANSTITKTLNSSLTIAVDEGKPGLGVVNWFSNGTDMSLVATAVGANISSEYFDRMRPSVRLYPTGLEQPSAEGGGGRRVAFKAVFEDLSAPDANASFASDCATWVSVTAAVYGSRPLDLFVFDLDANGKVTGVENAALRLKLDKVS